ncbi:hypothetical protein [Halalkalicoccus subterraneus]|uniref:hypothetical protein n=1 Tax=Halalkalicoccus subterraneus TaxID=2675002 RepID=UPI0013CE8917|nr:hypothetical protein [Halalkalicoccus subterraneus]
MSTDPETMERLVFIKDLYETAVNQSHLVAPLNAKSILTFHDATELFLYLASEELGFKAPHGFMEYWGEAKQHSSITLGQKSEMNRLNKARTNLKHHGIRPGQSDIDSLRASTQTFFEKNIPKIFSLDFYDISMTSLVSDDVIRAHLERAQRSLQNEKFHKCACDAALAFEKALADSKQRVKRTGGKIGMGPYPLRFGDPIAHDTFYKSSFTGESEDLAKDIEKSISSLTDILTILALGIDYRKYAKFDYLTPIVMRVMSGGYVLQSSGAHPDRYNNNVDEDDIQFCISFVVESWLQMKDFNPIIDA